MPVDSNIYAQFAPQAKSIADYQRDNQEQALRNQALQTNQLAYQNAQLDFSQKQEAQKQMNALLPLMASGSVDPTTPEGQAQMRSVAPLVADAKLKDLLALQHSAAQSREQSSLASQHEQTTRVAARQDSARQYLGSFDTVQDGSQLKQWMSGAVSSGLLPMSEATARIATVPDGPLPPDFKDKLGQLLREKLLTPQEAYKSHAGKLEKTDAGGAVELGTYSDADGYKQIKQVTKTPTPGEITTDRRVRDREAQVDASGEVSLSDDAIANAAARYNVDGTMPTLGYGKSSKPTRDKILNVAAQMARDADPNATPEENRLRQLRMYGDKQANAQLAKQQTMVGAFEKTFNANADIALELSQKVDRTGAPVLNRWLLAGKRSVAGDPDVAALDQAMKSVQAEYAKIISGSMGNTPVAEGQIKDAETKLNSAQTPEQVMAVIGVMKRETKNRMKGFDDQRAELSDRMAGKKAPATAQTTPAANVSTDGWKYLGSK